MKNPIIPFYRQSDKLVVKAKGCYLYDSEGNQYIDFESGDWAANLGHSHEKINQAIKNQIDCSIHDGLRFRNEPSEICAFRLMEKLAMDGGKCVFLNSGSEAVNLGITLAMNLTRRKKILKMDCSFLSSFGYGKISPENTHLINIPMNNADAIKQINLEEIAAFVFEPGNAHGLIKFPTNDFINKIATSIKQHGGLLMANEVTTGFGRTGKWFGFQHYNYKPDIVSVGKGLGNGYPVSCVTISKEVSGLFDMAPFRYAQSHQNDPLGCAVGLAVINTFDEEGIIQQSFEKGKYFEIRLLELQSHHKDKIKEVRARGLMLALELAPEIKAEDIYLQLIDKGYLVGQKENVLRFMPPFIMEEGLMIQLINTLDNLL
jgi:acetylornithine/N-succinyldiaminopimelate aminotransferase